jgi:hypothetical protein
MLDDEKLDVYQCAIEHLAFVYAIARGEAIECGAIIDVIRLIEAVPEPDLTAAKQLLVRVVEMLSKMCR